MKKILRTLAYISMLTLTADADILKVEGGAGAWMQTPKGEISYTEYLGTGTDSSTQKDSTQTYAWIYIKHFVPIIPNLRVEYVDVENQGVATGRFKNFNVPISSSTSLKMKQYDIIPYYNLLDNTFWMTIDLGLDIKIVEANYEAQTVKIFGMDTTYNDSETLYIPLVYLRGRVEIPKTNIGIEADGKFVTYSGHTIYDVRAKVDYTLDFIPVIKPAIEVGYRVQKFDMKDDGAKVDLEFSGMYVGAYLRF